MQEIKRVELAPIVIFTYNRPNHLRQVIDALSQNELAPESVLYIYCDGAKPLQTEENADRNDATTSARKYFKGTSSEYEKYLSDIEENRKVAHLATGFKEIHVVERPQNIGLKDNIVGAVTELVNKYGKIITLEDDIITSKGFLRYMNDALEVYKDEEKVMHISAYMYPHKCKLPDTFFYPVPYPGGGWATWKRAWLYYNDNTQELYDSWKDKWNQFDILGSDYLSKQLINNQNGSMNTWFIKWYAVLLQQSGLTLYPGKSLTNNIGFDNTATNCFFTTKFDVMPTDTVIIKKHPVKRNKKSSRVIFDFYQGHWYNRRRRNALVLKIKKHFMFWK